MGVIITILAVSLFTSVGSQTISETAEWIEKNLPKPKADK